jgi:xylan 1,4-beta-xylosidase
MANAFLEVAIMRIAAVVAMSGLFAGAQAGLEAQVVEIRVNAEERRGPVTPMWTWFGHDEPNYTYMRNGRKLLDELVELSPAPVHIRTHNLLTSGDGTAALKWGSTNAYTEDSAGNPVYDWTIMDRIMDTHVERGIRPLVEIGFMPEALTTGPLPYRHTWQPGDDYGDIYTGWAYPPKDYVKWSNLVYEWARHSVERYGREEVETWHWQVWNEPDIGYWRGTKEEYFKLYDYAAAGLKRALPTAKIGGPHVTGPRGERTQQYLRDFIEHCLRGTNYATGETGSPLDFVAFHAKGAPRVMEDGHVRMGLSGQLDAISHGFEIVASFPAIAGIPIVIGESDPEGCAACPTTHYPQYGYRNGTMFSSYTAAQLARTWELAELYGVNLLGSLSWAFQFEDQPYFAGFRALATNGIDKPVLNTFRMLGMMRGDWIMVESTGALPLETVRAESVRGQPDINAIATRAEGRIAVLIWNYHDDDLPVEAATVEVLIEELPAGSPRVAHYRVDRKHSNSYEVWKAMGSPAEPTPEQYAALEQAGQLAMIDEPRVVDVTDGRVRLSFALPRQAVSLITLDW